MTPLEAALAAWIAFHFELGVDMEAYLLPPATEAQIVEVEEVIGYRLPDDLRELYKIANGQWYMFDDDINVLGDVDPDQRWAPLFGNYDFMPLQKALSRYEFYLDIYDSEIAFSTKYNQANSDKIIEPIVWEVRQSDAVDPAGWNPNWFTFAGSDANVYSVDLSPPRGGSPGQVVLHGADEYLLQVPGHSVTDLMEQAVVHLSADEPHRYQYEERDDLYMASVFFNMDWRGELYIPQEQSVMPPAYIAWADEQEHAQNLKHEQLVTWLQGRDLPAEQHNSLLQWYDMRLGYRFADSPPLSVIMKMQVQRISQGEMPHILEILNGIAHSVSSRMSSNMSPLYEMELASTLFTGSIMLSDFDLNLTSGEAMDLYHQFKFESGEWSQAEFNRVDALKIKLQKLPINTDDGFSMSSDGSNLSICTSSFDEETFKSDDVCHEIDLLNSD